MKTISSRQNPLVARYRSVRRGEPGDLILLDGVHLLGEAISAGVRIREVAVTAEAAGHPGIAAAVSTLARLETPVVAVAARVMDALSPVRSTSGVVALAERPVTSPDRMYQGTIPTVAIAVDVQDPGNVGAIVRVVEAAGATGFVAAGACADPFGWKALRGSAGSALRLPIALQPDARRAIGEARGRGCRILAAAPRDGRPVFEADCRPPVALLVGSEGQGLPRALLADADERITVPMHPPVESLNAAVTAALILYEAYRQRMTRSG